MTKLFNSIIVGPIHSRRLGSSLGINLLPQYGKLCNFDCIYCECGWNKDGRVDSQLPTAEEVEEALSLRLKEAIKENIHIDSITYSGNGEPTLHPQFAEIVDITVKLRDRYYPSANISLLSNATRIGREDIRKAISKVDNPILKIDSPINEYIKKINRPWQGYCLSEIIENLKSLKGNFILQTMFLKGEFKDESDSVLIDCTSEQNVQMWRDLVRVLSPRKVMIYSLDRPAPQEGLVKVSAQKMKEIAQPLIDEGFKIDIAE